MKTVWDNVQFFENLVADYAGSKYAVAVDSCTNALFLSMMLCKHHGIAPANNTIKVPSRTYISVPMQVKHCGFNVEFTHDYWSGTYNLDPLPVVDSAQRFTKNMYISGTLYCLSFHSKKTLSIGRGGMILTDNQEYKDWLVRSRHDGRSSIFYNDITDQTVPTIGWHMYMTPQEAITGVEQFYKTPEINHDTGCSDDYKIDLSKIKCLS